MLKKIGKVPVVTDERLNNAPEYVYDMTEVYAYNEATRLQFHDWLWANRDGEHGPYCICKS